jgi:hypothetical protein
MADSLIEDGPPANFVIDFIFHSEDTDSKLTVMCNSKRILIRLTADSFSESPPLEEKYRRFLQVFEDELDGWTVDDFYDWVLEPFLPLFRGLPPPRQDTKPTLQDFSFPKTLCYTLHVVAGELSPCPDENEMMDEPTFGAPLSKELCSSWPSFGPSEIEICDDHRRGTPPLSTPTKVQPFGGTTPFFLKPVGLGDIRSAEREIKNYKKMRDAELPEDLHVPRLHGIVEDKTGLVFGLFLTYIECEAVTLRCALRREVPMSLRHKWADQIKSAVDALHKAGVTWSDVKPDNVLVDLNQDAWVVDFGGSYTKGWVDKQTAGTVEGDREGLAEILAFIGI